ncbi:MAG: hypothetical protein FRX49_09656 [Trebouxia sp. A1-2]|nr:MAG: hypothetical protein FRX49_09656 [Trebouxia sp. A1-2]
MSRIGTLQWHAIANKALFNLPFQTEETDALQEATDPRQANPRESPNLGPEPVVKQVAQSAQAEAEVLQGNWSGGGHCCPWGSSLQQWGSPGLSHDRKSSNQLAGGSAMKPPTEQIMFMSGSCGSMWMLGTTKYRGGPTRSTPYRYESLGKATCCSSPLETIDNLRFWRKVPSSCTGEGCSTPLRHGVTPYASLSPFPVLEILAIALCAMPFDDWPKDLTLPVKDWTDEGSDPFWGFAAPTGGDTSGDSVLNAAVETLLGTASAAMSVCLVMVSVPATAAQREKLRTAGILVRPPKLKARASQAAADRSMLASKMMRVAHIPNKLQIARAANTDSPTINTPVRPNPTLLYTSTAQEEEPAGMVPSANAMYNSMTKYETATVAESEAVSRASSSSTERSEEKLSLRLASAARSLRRVWAS